MTFDEFMKECDAICEAEIGVGVHAMPDLLWRDFHEDGLSPQDAIDCAMEEWGMDMEGVW